MTKAISIVMEVSDEQVVGIENFLGECKYIILLAEDGASKVAVLNRGKWEIEEDG